MVGPLKVKALCSIPMQALSSITRVKPRYYYAPDQFIGVNEEHQSGRRGIVDERLSSHIWSSRVFHNVTPDLSVQILGRFGLRRYSEAFSERNASFWTVGAHVGWRVSHRIARTDLSL